MLTRSRSGHRIAYDAAYGYAYGYGGAKQRSCLADTYAYETPIRGHRAQHDVRDGVPIEE